MKHGTQHLSPVQQFLLVGLRTLIGWHFLYEGYIKLAYPAWGRDGRPLSHWSSAGYLKSATGPLAGFFQSMGDASWIGRLDLVVAVGLILVGLSLLLGFFTQLGCAGAMGLLVMFYVSAIPTGIPDWRAEGSYLIVNKNLIELAAVAVVFVFRTGRIAGLDGWSARSRVVAAPVKEATA